MVEGYQTPKGHGREVHVAPLDHDEVAHYPGGEGWFEFCSYNTYIIIIIVFCITYTFDCSICAFDIYTTTTTTTSIYEMKSIIYLFITSIFFQD